MFITPHFFFLSWEYLSCNSCSRITRFPRYNDPLKVFLLEPIDKFIFHNLLPCCLILLSPLSPCSSWKLEGVAVGNGPIALLFIVVLLAMNLVWYVSFFNSNTTPKWHNLTLDHVLLDQYFSDVKTEHNDRSLPGFCEEQ